MEIQVYTDRRLDGQEDLIPFIGFEVVAGLGPYAARVTAAEVDLAEESPRQGGEVGLRCVLEVRPLGHAPLAVIRRAATSDAAVRGAVVDMRHLLERMFRRVDVRVRDAKRT